MTDAKDAPMCTCGDDWHANNAANHSPSCPVLDHIATLTRERDEALAMLSFTGETSLWQAAAAANQEVGYLRAERDALRKVDDTMVDRACVARVGAYNWQGSGEDEREAMRKVRSAALGTQP